MMMKERQINTKYYSITINKIKNRIIIKPIGFWRSVNTVPNYLDSIFQAIDRDLMRHFMVVLEISEMLTHPADVQEKIHYHGVMEILKRKPKALVVVMPQDDISFMQANFLNKKVGLPMKSFETLAEAEAFLDAYATKHGLL
ncbi:MAG: hypothetical protein ACPGJS_21670 [Flammeovirgaceae bacterium]